MRLNDETLETLLYTEAYDDDKKGGQCIVIKEKLEFQKRQEI